MDCNHMCYHYALSALASFCMIFQVAWSQEATSLSHFHPKFHMTFVLFYNNSGDTAITDQCGHYYAQTILNNYVSFESLLQNEGNCSVGSKLNVNLGELARVRLFGTRAELKTHANISLESGLVFDVTAMNQIIECAKMLRSSLGNPQRLQEQYNAGKDPFYHINVLRIPRNGSCEAVTLNPQSFTFDKGDWICDDPNHEFSQERLKCMLYETPNPTPIATTTVDSGPVIPYPSTIPPDNYWLIQLLNNTRSLFLKEGNDPVSLYFKVLINRTKLCGSNQQCKVVVSLNVESSPSEVLKCRKSADIIPQIVYVQSSWGDEKEVCSFTIDANSTTQSTKLVQIAPMLDSKYDGTQHRDLTLSITSIINGVSGPSDENVLQLPITIEDEDQKATCKSINDPHIATFDGLEYNNFYEGEFVLYKHLYLPFKVHVIYQRCGPGIPASCNCAVAVQSGDDVIVIDRCYRKHKSFNRISGTFNPYATILTIGMYLNNDLTPGTSIYQEADGKKYYIYLPHGGVVKVMVSGDLLNVWVIASPKDKFKTTGLCGTYDDDITNDFQLQDGTYFPYSNQFNGYRLQPREFCVDWRVELYGEKSIFRGVRKEEVDIKSFPVYCDCSQGYRRCGYAVDLSLCDVIQGLDITNFLIDRAKTPVVTSVGRKRKKRQSEITNVISALPPEDPIDIDTSYVPEDPTWGNSDWTEETAQQFCLNYVKDQYNIGKLCEKIPAVDFNQEITTCIEDIQITGNTTWANSARDAMKEQCLEEVQRNTSLPSDIANEVQNAICINDCSDHGQCVQGSCKCVIGWTTADCSQSAVETPYSAQLPSTGLCDTRYMKCHRVMVYGNDFIPSPNLTCHLQEAKVTDKTSGFQPQARIVKKKALYINFNAVECPIPDEKIYLIRVSNDGNFGHASDPLLFMPFDSACTTCSTNTTSCTKKKNSCIIDGKCFMENEINPSDRCLVCKMYDDNLQWTTAEGSCRVSWWADWNIPTWGVVLIGAIAVTMTSIMCALCLYFCCCKSRTHKKSPHHHHSNYPQNEAEDLHSSDQSHHNYHLNRNNPHYHPANENSEITESDTTTNQSDAFFEESMLHRNRGLPKFTDVDNNRFIDLPFHHNNHINSSHDHQPHVQYPDSSNSHPHEYIDHSFSFPNSGSLVPISLTEGGGSVLGGGGSSSGGGDSGVLVDSPINTGSTIGTDSCDLGETTKPNISVAGRSRFQNGVDSTTYF